MLELRDIRYSVRARTILDGVTMKFPPARLTAILGPNGAGKSTLIRIAAGLLAPTRGEVVYGGRPVASMRAPELARLRAVLTQHAEPALSLLAEEVVEMGRYPWFTRVPGTRDREAVTRALEAVGMVERRFQTFSTMSAGERQQIQMARVIAQMDGDEAADRVVFLDEPTSSLDVRHQLTLLGLVRGLLARGITVVAVLHDLNLAADHADHFMVLEAGRIVHQGTREAGLPESLVELLYDVHAHRVVDPADGRAAWRFRLRRAPTLLG
jgi:iron complex transport system ATP-binding protein